MVEQIHGVTNEEKWNTYGFYGYWAKDWTILDPNFGTKAESKELVEKTHAKGIRVVLDAVVKIIQVQLQRLIKCTQIPTVLFCLSS